MASSTSFGIVRFIPACVGNAPVPAGHHIRQPVHPRVCGERTVTAPLRTRDVGSSPRVWGTHAAAANEAANDRFIPACVGNATASMHGMPISTVHPRVCGERCTHLRRKSAVFGSSPRVWGTLIAGNRQNVLRRFIPACVGNAMQKSIRIGASAVHPRVCGER